VIATSPRLASTTLPFFRFGAPGGARRGATRPLGIVSGGLLLDSGEADPTFVFRCQDRYLTYTSLLGLRTVFFVHDDAHAAHYAALIARQRERYAAVAALTGVLAASEILEPLYVGCDVATLRVASNATFARQARALADGDAGAPDAAGTPVELCFNQIAPGTARLAAQVDALLRAAGVPTAFDRAACDAAGALGLFFHDKAQGVALVRGAGGAALPPHAETAILTPTEFLRLESWADLVACYRARSGDPHEPASLYVKSSRDSGGNVAARLGPAEYDRRFAALAREVGRSALGAQSDLAERVAVLRADVALAPSLRGVPVGERDLADFARGQAARRAGMTILVQRDVAPHPADPRPGGIGLSYLIGGPGQAAPLAVAAQIYADAERRHFLGSYLDDALAAAVLTPELSSQMNALCERYAAVGYRGPINFDARLDADGRYVLIHDCNPRLSAVFPALALRDALRAAGREPRSVLSLGYRGEFVAREPAGFVAQLDACGALYTRERAGGVLVLPNLAREDGFDALLIDVEPARAGDLLAALRACAGDAGAAPERLYA
jgi:hypothetical protein